MTRLLYLPSEIIIINQPKKIQGFPWIISQGVSSSSSDVLVLVEIYNICFKFMYLSMVVLSKSGLYVVIRTEFDIKIFLRYGVFDLPQQAI